LPLIFTKLPSGTKPTYDKSVINKIKLYLAIMPK
jgi:hypothetical protein